MPRSELPPELGRQFGAGQARRAGVSKKRLAGTDLTAEFRGSRTRRGNDPPPADALAARYRDLLMLCGAYLPVAPADFQFSHVTGARIHRIPLPEALETRTTIDVTVAGSTVPRREGVIGHRAVRLPRTVLVEGLPVVSVERAWIQLAPLLTLDELIVAGDFLVRRKQPASTIANLTAAAHASAGAPGAARARAAIDEIRPGTDSPRESRLRLVIVRAGLPEPVIGHTVYFQNYFVGTPDLAYVRERIALDYDGAIHREDERVYTDDVERRQLFADADWRYITVTRENIRVPRSFLLRLDRLLRERG